MNTKWISVAACILITATLSVAAARIPNAQARSSQPRALAEPSLPADLAPAVTSALSAHPSYSGTHFAITSAHIQADWALVSVGALDGPTALDGFQEGYIGSRDGGLLLIAAQENGRWQITIEGEPDFAAQARRAPDALLSPQAKSLLAPRSNTSPSAAQAVNYKWPWPAGLSWRWLQGWHTRAMDIGTDGADKRVLASADGVIIYVCKGNLGAALKVRDADGVVLEYWHIDSALLSGAVQLGATVSQGQWLGTLRPGSWTDSSACGTQYTSQNASTGHVHWVLPTDRTFTVDGWSITFPNSTFVNGEQSRTCNGGCWASANFFASSNQPHDEPNPPAATPTPSLTPTETATPTDTPLPTTTATPIISAALSIEPAFLVTQTGRLITAHVVLRSADIDLSELTLGIGYSPTVLSLEGIATGGALTVSEFLTASIITETPGLLLFEGVLTTPTRYASAVPLFEIGLRANGVGLESIRIISASLVSASGQQLVPAQSNGVIFVVGEGAAAGVYLPFVTREDAGNSPSTPSPASPTPTLMPTQSSTSTSIPANTSTSTSTPTEMASESATSTPTSTEMPMSTDTQTPTQTPTSTPLSSETVTPTPTTLLAQ